MKQSGRLGDKDLNQVGLNNTTRRTFIKSAAAAGLTLAAGVPGCVSPGKRKGAARTVTPRQDKLRLAYIGTGGMGGSHVKSTKDMGIVCPCFCDVDTNRMAKAAELYPQAARYQDYREMFDKESKNFDAVMIGVPDHHHYPASMLAMQAGKHVYTQKPLTHTPWEARQLTRAAEKHQVVTQMGNQGHAGEGWRLVYEWIHSGALGDIVETHTWTDRPVWPQGMVRSEKSDPPPANLNWDAWLGPAPERPFKGPDSGKGAGPYHWFNWRGWWDFGAGALGDMACHTMDGVFWALDPGHPDVIEVLASTAIEPRKAAYADKESFPKSSVIRWKFPRKGRRRAFSAYWYDGGLRPTVPDILELPRRLPNTGNLFVGTKATLMVSRDYGQSPRIIPESKHKEIGKPPQLLERSPGHIEEWIMACKGEEPMDFPKSRFAYSGPMSETILLGNVALRMGRRLEWDGEEMEVTNLPEANQFISKEYRAGWRFDAL